MRPTLALAVQQHDTNMPPPHTPKAVHTAAIRFPNKESNSSTSACTLDHQAPAARKTVTAIMAARSRLEPSAGARVGIITVLRRLAAQAAVSMSVCECAIQSIFVTVVLGRLSQFLNLNFATRQTSTPGPSFFHTISLSPAFTSA